MKNQIEKRMKRLIIPGLIFMITSCSKDVEVCISGDMSPDVPGTYTYTWCGENAENIEWQFDGATYAGQSVTLDLYQKQQYHLTVKGKGKRKEATESYSINVGTYEVRVEPKMCDDDYLNVSGTYKAYLYSDKATFQSDFRNNVKTNCIDSVLLEQSYYYGGTSNNSAAAMTGSFGKALSNGDYLVYVVRTDVSSGINNLGQLFLYNSNLTVLGNAYDDVSYVMLNTLNSTNDNESFNNLFSKTFVLTSVWLNGSSMGVSPCNSDDELIFNLDNTWSLQVGPDDCSGAQSNSSGTFSGSTYCQTSGSTNYSAATTTGSMPANFTFIHTSSNKVKITAYDGGNTLETEYTGQ